MNILDSKTFSAMILNGYKNLKANHEKINDLNVFPVPDGDTGTNMTATLGGGIKLIENLDTNSIGVVAEKLSNGMLLGARGNSGVILSQFFAGIADGLKQLESSSIEDFSEALTLGTAKAYNAVVKPVEGTILTVARVGSQSIADNLSSLDDFESLFKLLIKKMNEALQDTPNLLPVLKEAGVIDSGGAGLISIIEGMSKYILGEEIEDTHFESPSNSAQINGEIAFNADSVMTYGYCTEFILQLQNAKCKPAEVETKTFIDFLSTIGDSIVCVKNDSIIKVHVHTLTPWKVIQFAQQYGEFITIKMENMSIQHNEVLLKEEKKERTSVAVVAVAPSEEIASTFISMGVTTTVKGGQTMNPSAEDFVNSFNEANADTIIVFPNNGNVILTAEQAAEMYKDSKVIVIRSKSPVQCYSALTMYDPDNCSIEENIEAFNSSIGNVIACEICPAVRDSVNNGLSIKKDDFMGITGGAVVSSEKNIIDAAMKMFESIEDIDYRSLMTVFVGKDASEECVNNLRNAVTEKYPLIEFGDIKTNQNIYPFIIGIE